MTLVEVMFAMGIFSLLMLGILRAFLQTRRLTEGSIYQETAQTIVTGYIEQLKTTPINYIKNSPGSSPANIGTSFAIQTLYDNLTNDYLWTTTGTPPALSTITPGTTPAGVVDNLRSFDMSTSTTTTNVTGLGAFTNGPSPLAWSTIWPGANNYPATIAAGTTPSTTPYDYSTRVPDNSDLHLNLWVWVQDLSVAGSANNVYGITVIYTFQFVEGGRRRYQMGEVRTIRSNALTVKSPLAGA
jgi:Tfp pilus assembly protein PilV